MRWVIFPAVCNCLVAQMLVSPSPDTKSIQQIVFKFSWEAVFWKINLAYEKVLSN